MESMVKINLINKEGNVEIIGDTGEAVDTLAIGVALAVEMITASQSEFSREIILAGLIDSIKDAIYTSYLEVESENGEVMQK